MKKYIKNPLTFLFIIFFTVFTNAEYRLGVDYRIVDNPLPVKRDGIVEVTETFWYGCGGCYQFDPAVNAWSSKQGSDVKFSKVPVTWSAVHQMHASLYYTIEALKLDSSAHAAVFVTIHKEGIKIILGAFIFASVLMVLNVFFLLNCSPFVFYIITAITLILLVLIIS